MWYEWITSNYDDVDLTPENIRKNKNIFWVEGTFEGSWGGNIPIEESISFWWGVYNWIRFWNLYIFTWASAPWWTELAISSLWDSTINKIAQELWKTLIAQKTTTYIIWWWNRIITYNSSLDLSEYSQSWWPIVMCAILQ